MPLRTSVLGSTTTIMAAIVLMSALGSFGAVRAFLPRPRTSSLPAAAASTVAASATVAPRADASEVGRPTAAGRLSIVTDPAGLRVEIDGRPRGVSPIAIDGLAAAEHRITVRAESGVVERRVAVSSDVVTEVVFSLPKPT